MKADKNLADPPTHGAYVNVVASGCRQVAGDPIVVRCVATIEAPEEPEEEKRFDRDEREGLPECIPVAAAVILSRCMYRGGEDPCDNFRFRRHWYWIKENKDRRWPAGSRCVKDPDANLPEELRSEVYTNRRGRSVLHCWYIREGDAWGRHLG